MENNYNKKLRESIEFSIEKILEEFYGIEDIDMEKFKHIGIVMDSYEKFFAILNLGTTFSLSYFFTSKDNLENDVCINIGIDLSEQGLEELDKFINKHIEKSFENSKFDNTYIKTIKDFDVSFDLNIEEIKKRLVFITELCLDNQIELLNIKNNFYEKNKLCSKCQEVIVTNETNVCNRCLGN